MGTMGMVIRRGLGELGPFLFVFQPLPDEFGFLISLGRALSRSVMKQMIALWSIGVVASLIFSGFTYLPVFTKTRGTKVAESRGAS